MIEDHLATATKRQNLIQHSHVRLIWRITHAWTATNQIDEFESELWRLGLSRYEPEHAEDAKTGTTVGKQV